MFEKIKVYLQLLFLFLILCIITYSCFAGDKKAKWQGMSAPDEPIQTKLDAAEPQIKYKNAKLIPLANYDVTGVVISTKRYFFDAGSSVSPIDIVLAWDKMSDADVINKIRFKHRRRCILYYPSDGKQWPISFEDIQKNISNNHCIPADSKIKKKLFSVKKYDVVNIKGKLVSVRRDGFENWTSSLSRTDGMGTGELYGCEIIYITDVDILKSL